MSQAQLIWSCLSSSPGVKEIYLMSSFVLWIGEVTDALIKWLKPEKQGETGRCLLVY